MAPVIYRDKRDIGYLTFSEINIQDWLIPSHFHPHHYPSKVLCKDLFLNQNKFVIHLPINSSIARARFS